MYKWQDSLSLTLIKLSICCLCGAAVMKIRVVTQGPIVVIIMTSIRAIIVITIIIIIAII